MQTLLPIYNSIFSNIRSFYYI